MDVKIKEEPVEPAEGARKAETADEKKGLHCAHCGFVTSDYEGMMEHMTGHATLSHTDPGQGTQRVTESTPDETGKVTHTVKTETTVTPEPSVTMKNAFTMNNRSPLPAIKDKIFQEISFGQNKSVRYYSCGICQFWSCFCGVVRYHVDTEHHLLEHRLNKYRCAVCKKEYPGLYPVLLHLNIQHGITQMNNKVLETGNRMADSKMKSIQENGLTYVQPNVLGVESENIFQCFQCKMCEKVYPSDACCRQHLLSAHLSYIGVHTCRCCDFKCSFEADMKNHLKSCHSEQPVVNFKTDADKMKAAENLTITNTDRITVTRDQLALDVELILGEIAQKIQHSVVLLPIAILNGLNSVDMTSTAGSGWNAMQAFAKAASCSSLKQALTASAVRMPISTLVSSSLAKSPLNKNKVEQHVMKTASTAITVPQQPVQHVPPMQQATPPSGKKRKKKSQVPEEKSWEPGSVADKKLRSESAPTRYSLRETRSRINYKDILEEFDTEESEEEVLERPSKPVGRVKKTVRVPSPTLVTPVSAEPVKTESDNQPMYSVQLTPNVVMLNTCVDPLPEETVPIPEVSRQPHAEPPKPTVKEEVVDSKPMVSSTGPVSAKPSSPPGSTVHVNASPSSSVSTPANKNMYIEKYGERFLDFFNNRKKFKYHNKSQAEIVEELLQEEFQQNRMCYMCQKCGFLTVNMDESEQHIRKLHLTHIKPMRCKGCRSEFSNAKEFLKHIRMHPTLANNKTEPLMQKGVLNLKKAANQSMEAKKNCILLNLGNCYMGPSEECSRDLEEMKTAPDWAIPTFECQDCKAKHLSEEIVKEHIIIKHITSEKKKHMYKCDYCPYSTTTFTFLRWHVKNHHKSVTEEIKYRDPRDLAGNYVTKVKCKDLDTLALVIKHSGTIKRLKTSDFAEDSGDDDILDEFPLPDPKYVSAMLPVMSTPANSRPVGRPAKAITSKVTPSETIQNNGTGKVNGVKQDIEMESEDKDDVLIVSSKPGKKASSLSQNSDGADSSRSNSPATKIVKKSAIVYECEHCSYSCESYSDFTHHKESSHPGLDDL